MNSISRLNEIAQHNRCQPPTYTFSFEDGGYIACCHYQDKISVSGMQKSKRLAKSEASTFMLTMISNVMVVGFDPTPLWDGAQEICVSLRKNGSERTFVLKVT